MLPKNKAAYEGVVRVEEDELGEYACIIIDTSVYTEVVIFKAAYWYTNRFYLFLSRDENSQQLRIEMRAKEVLNANQLSLACRDFCNSLVDYRVRQAVLTETGGIRDVIIRKAFGEGRKHLDPDNLGSDETHVPESKESFHEDAHGIGKPTGSG